MPLPPEYLRQITRDEMNALPIRRYEGEVRLVESVCLLERAAEDILQQAAVGFDTETRPAFRKGESHLPSLAQVATARAVYLFPLQRLDCSALLAELLAAPHIVNAGVALADDLRQLQQLFAFEAAAALDLGHVARRHGLKQTGLRNLTGIFLGTRIPKGTKTTNWAAPRLTPQQITYAATDAWACRELYLRFAALGLL
jgi:ribonuclease D